MENNLIKEVIIDGLAALRIIKHCNDSLPTMVAGSLLGVDHDGVLEITYSYSFTLSKNDGDIEEDGTTYQIEMMKMLRDVNIENNCVGWYQSMYSGLVSTTDFVGYQYSYQSSEDLSENSIAIMYDPIQSKKGNLVLKAFRLSPEFIELKRNKSNKFIRPEDMLQEVPIKIRNAGHISGFLRSLQDTHANEIDCAFESLSLNNSEINIEKYLGLLGTWADDMTNEQLKFQAYSKNISKFRQEHIRWMNKTIAENKEANENGEPLKSIKIKDSGLKPLPDAPSRHEMLLTLGQIDRYCNDISDLTTNTIKKLTLSNHLNKLN